MDLRIEPINNYMMSRFLLADKKLAIMSLCDEHLKELDAGLGFNPALPIILGVFKDKELICCLLVTMLTNITFEWHIYLSTRHHGNGTSKEVKKVFIKWLKNNTKCKNLTTNLPVVCTWVHKALIKNGAKLVGTIPKGIVWREKETDLNIYYERI